MNEAAQLILSLIQQVREAQDEYSDEELEEIFALLSRAAEVIQAQEISGPGLPPKEIPAAPYASSNINGFKYDPATKNLLVKFMGKDTADSGPTYSYEGVPPFIVDVFARGAIGPKTSGKNKYHAWFKGITPSHGAAMNALIKMGGFPYQKVA